MTVKENRKYVAKLVLSVLTEQVCVKNALLKFPKDETDDSIICAWHALCHFEADEELKQKNSLYKDEQEQYLHMLYEILQKGNPLPQEIINNYKQFYTSAQIPTSNSWKGLWATLLRFLNIK